MPTPISPDRIRALGFEWPGAPKLAEAAVMTNGDVDLTATLARVEADLAFYLREISAARMFSRTWDAPIDDVTDRMDEYVEGAAACRAALHHVRAIVAAIEV
jgi:hypothetical protein